MRQDRKEPAIDMISMEEYLKKRQAIRMQENAQGIQSSEEPASALKLAELLYV